MYTKKFKYAVVFDLDGVILDSERLSIECWKIIANKYQIPDIETAVNACMGLCHEQAKEKMKEIYGDSFDFDLYKKHKNAIYKKMYEEKKLSLKPGVVKALTVLKKNDVPIGLATSTKSDVVKKELCDFGLYHFFDVIICGDMITKGKPDPEVYKLACSRIGIEPSRCYAVEDSYNGVMSARKAGITTVYIPDIQRVCFSDSGVIVMKDLFEFIDYIGLI